MENAKGKKINKKITLSNKRLHFGFSHLLLITFNAFYLIMNS